MKKFLLLFGALFTMGVAFADTTIDLTGENTATWVSATGEVNADGSVTITYASAWDAYGWTYWEDGEHLDISEYAEMVVNFKDNTAGSITLFLGDTAEGSVSPDYTTDSEGKLIFYIADYEGDCDLSSIGQLMFQCSQAGNVTIESIELLDEKVEEEVADYVIDITDTSSFGYWDPETTDNMVVNADGTVTLTITDEEGGLGWTNWWPNWDFTAYNYLVLKYRDVTGEEGAHIGLFVQDTTTYACDEVYDEDNTGTIVFAFEDYPSINYASIGQIIVQAVGVPVSVTIESLKAVVSLDEDEDGDTEPGPVVEGDNLWSAVEDGSAYNGVYEYWATGDSWSLIYEGTSTGQSGEYWSHEDGVWTITMPENAGTTQWQAQVHIQTSLPVSGDTEYSFACDLLCDADGAATIKLTDSGNDGNFFFDGVHSFAANETYSYVAEGVTMGDAESVKLVFDFAGTPGNAVVKVSNIIFNEGSELVADGITEVEAAAPVAKKGIYNLAGQRVNANAKGLLIIDGKKVLVK